MDKLILAISALVILLVGYGCGVIHCFLAHWGREKVYCPRCRYYLKWSDTVLREVIPDRWQTLRERFPW